MLDIKYIRENTDKVKKGIAAKNYKPELIDELVKADDSRLESLRIVQDLRTKRNQFAKEKNIEEGKKLKGELTKVEESLKAAEEKFNTVLGQIPNLPEDGVPEGKGEADNVEKSKWGDVPKFDFEPKDHVELGKNLDILDFEAGAKVAGSGFYYLKNDGALLEIALTLYGLNFLTKKGFTPFITPDLARARYYLGTGYLPQGPEAQIYEVKDQDLGLIATAEVTLAGYHADEVLLEKDLPKKYAGYSHCFRQEAGAYGKYSKGLYRVHQFTKVEMFAYVLPKDSPAMHKEMLALEEEFWQSLEIPYRVLEMCTGDLGAIAARKYDLEAWMPGRGDYGEITSTSNATDYQARRLNIKYKKGAETGFAHLLNGTLVATSRGIIAILENNQQKEGSVKVPKVLQDYLGKEVITKGN